MKVNDLPQVLDFLKNEVDTDVKIMSPGFVIRDAEACAYDTILSVRVTREAFEFGQKYRNFIQGPGNPVKFEDYLGIV